MALGVGGWLALAGLAVSVVAVAYAYRSNVLREATDGLLVLVVAQALFVVNALFVAVGSALSYALVVAGGGCVLAGLRRLFRGIREERPASGR